MGSMLTSRIISIHDLKDMPPIFPNVKLYNREGKDNSSTMSRLNSIASIAERNISVQTYKFADYIYTMHNKFSNFFGMGESIHIRSQVSFAIMKIQAPNI